MVVQVANGLSQVDLIGAWALGTRFPRPMNDRIVSTVLEGCRRRARNKVLQMPGHEAISNSAEP